MTRINTVDVSVLSNLHCLKEYQELPRVITHVRKLLEKGKPFPKDKIPTKYKLGSGHVTFFYDKLEFIMDRLVDLYNELETVRGYNMDYDKLSSILSSANEIYEATKTYQISWKPDHEAQYLNMARLVMRSEFETDKQEINRFLKEDLKKEVIDIDILDEYKMKAAEVFEEYIKDAA